MNIVNKLTLRHLKVNMKRTVVTVLGIIISVAMVTAVFTSAVSFMKFMQNVEIAYGGNWYSSYDKCSLNDVAKLSKSSNVQSVSAERIIGLADIDLKNVNQKNQTGVIEVNAAFYHIYGIKLSEGTYPSKEGEILVAKSFISENKLNWKVGDTVTVPTFSEAGDFKKNAPVQKQYKITGITNTSNNLTDGTAFISALDENYSGSDITANVLNTKLDNGIWDTTKANAQSIGRKDADSYHDELLMYAGLTKNNAMLASIGGFAAVILIIIIIASVAMIYNSFAVSFQQRSRYLGMLASVGATKHQKRSSVYFEGLLLGAIGIPIGVIAGIGGIAVTFRCISGMILSAFAIPIDRPLSVTVNWFIVAGSVLISALTIFISALIPAKKASKTTAIDAIRQTNTVSAKAKKLKTSKLSGKIFGYEGQLAMKNYKRNGKRSRTITSALALSVILFLAVTSFSGAFSQLIGSNYGGAKSDLYVDCSRKDSVKVEKKLSEMKTVEGYTRSASSNVTLQNCAQYLNETGNKYKNKYDFSKVLVYAMDKSDFEAYCKKIGVNAEDYMNASSPKMIFVNRTTMKDVDGKSRQAVVAYSDMTGKTVKFSYSLGDEKKDAEKMTGAITVGAVTDKEANVDVAYAPSAYFVMPIDMFFSAFGETDGTISYAITAPDHAAAFDEIDQYYADNGIKGSRADAVKQLASMKAIMTVANVFAYGFITLITLISVANIVNTISTSMEERRREFAMIKSVGLTPKSFKKMIYLESIYYGFKSLLWGIPVGIAVNYLMYMVLSKTYDFGFKIVPLYYIIAIAAVFIIIAAALLYSTSKIKKDNIIETLKNEDT